MKLFIVAVPLMIILTSAKAEDDFMTPEDVEEMRAKLASHKEQIMKSDDRMKSMYRRYSEEKFDIHCVEELLNKYTSTVVNAIQELTGKLEEGLEGDRPMTKNEFSEEMAMAFSTLELIQYEIGRAATHRILHHCKYSTQTQKERRMESEEMEQP